MIRAEGTIRESTSGRELAVVDVVGSTGKPRDFGTAHGFDGDNGSESPEIGVGYPWVLRLDGFEEKSRVLETGVCRVASFGFVAHPCAVGTSSIGLDVVSACRMPVGRECKIVEVQEEE